MEYPIQQLARAAGTTSRTLRHYDRLGLVVPSRVGRNGYRYYDDRSLVRLQRVLLLRELGLGLETIGAVLTAQDAAAHAHESSNETEARVLAQHRDLLLSEKRRIEAQIASVDRTIAALRAASGDGNAPDELDASRGELAVPTTQKGESLMAQDIFDGFDHTEHRREVEERWGAEAYAKGDRWWRGLESSEQKGWQLRVSELSKDWVAAATAGVDPQSGVAQDLAQRHVEWLCSVPGTPARNGVRRASTALAGQDSAQHLTETAQLREYLIGLGEMYVADERFAANYGGTDGAAFVRDALRHYALIHLS